MLLCHTVKNGYLKVENFDKNEIKIIMPWLVKLGLQNSKTMTDYIIPFIIAIYS